MSDQDIERIEPYHRRYLDAVKNLSDASKEANDKWCWIMNKKAIERDIEENDQKEFLERCKFHQLVMFFNVTSQANNYFR